MNEATTARELDYRWAPATAISGIAGVLAYVAVGAAGHSLSPSVAVPLVFAFAFGITVASIGLYHVLGGATASPLLLIATVANVVAAGQLLAMIMIQMAVTDVVGHDTEFKAIWLGLDVAWDLYVGTGTMLFGLHMFLRRQLGAWLSLSGIVIGGLLLILNIATFPAPPVRSGLVDVGPLVGLWYLMVGGRLGVSSVLLKRRLRKATAS